MKLNIPDSIATRTDLSGDEKLVFAALRACAPNDQRKGIAMNELAAALGMERDALDSAIGNLLREFHTDDASIKPDAAGTIILTYQLHVSLREAEQRSLPLTAKKQNDPAPMEFTVGATTYRFALVEDQNIGGFRAYITKIEEGKEPVAEIDGMGFATATDAMSWWERWCDGRARFADVQPVEDACEPEPPDDDETVVMHFPSGSIPLDEALPPLRVIEEAAGYRVQQFDVNDGWNDRDQFDEVSEWCIAQCPPIGPLGIPSEPEPEQPKEEESIIVDAETHAALIENLSGKTLAYKTPRAAGVFDLDGLLWVPLDVDEQKGVRLQQCFLILDNTQLCERDKSFRWSGKTYCLGMGYARATVNAQEAPASEPGAAVQGGNWEFEIEPGVKVNALFMADWTATSHYVTLTREGHPEIKRYVPKSELSGFASSEEYCLTLAMAMVDASNGQKPSTVE